MATRRSAAPTLADVAAEAGVSQATASRALADSPLVNERLVTGYGGGGWSGRSASA